MTSILVSKNSTLSMHEEPIEPSTIIDERTTSYDETYGAGNWLITPTENLPADFSVNTYTIKDGALVPAPAELIAVRQAAATIAYNDAQRALRQAEYRALTDPLAIEIIADTTPEIAAIKAEIREKYPYK